MKDILMIRINHLLVKKKNHFKGKGKKHEDQFSIHQILKDEIEINQFLKMTKKTKVNLC
jgi:hypothetical protein